MSHPPLFTAFSCSSRIRLCFFLPHYPFTPCEREGKYAPGMLAGLLLLPGGGEGACSGDLTVILVVTGNIDHSGASNAKHILPQLDQSQAAWTTKCPVMPYFDHIIGE